MTLLGHETVAWTDHKNLIHLGGSAPEKISWRRSGTSMMSLPPQSMTKETLQNKDERSSISMLTNHGQTVRKSQELLRFFKDEDAEMDHRTTMPTLVPSLHFCISLDEPTVQLC
jgi:hypothetical protein